MIKPTKVPGNLGNKPLDSLLGRVNSLNSESMDEVSRLPISRKSSIQKDVEMIFKQIQIRKQHSDLNTMEILNKQLTNQNNSYNNSNIQNAFRPNPPTLAKKVKNLLKLNSHQLIKGSFKNSIAQNYKKNRFNSQTNSIINIQQDSILNDTAASTSQQPEDIAQGKSQQLLKNEISNIFKSKISNNKNPDQTSQAKPQANLLLIQSLSIKETANESISRNFNESVGDNQFSPLKLKPKARQITIRKLSVNSQQSIDNKDLFQTQIRKGAITVLDCNKENQPQNSAISYTQMKPKTEKNYKGLTKRLIFNRKEERQNLPILILNFDGVIGTFIKEDISSEQQILYVRQHFQKYLTDLFKNYQTVIMVDYPINSKAFIANEYLLRFLGNEYFFDGIYKSRVYSPCYEQIKNDFEINGQQEYYIIKPLKDIDMNVSYEMLVNTSRGDSNCIVITVPHILSYDAFVESNISIRSLSTFIKNSLNYENIRIMTQTLYSPEPVIKLSTISNPYKSNSSIIKYLNKEESSQSYSEMMAYNKLITSNYQIQQNIKKYQEAYRKRDVERVTKLETNMYDRQALKVINFINDLPKNAYCPLEKIQTIARNQLENEVVKDVLKRKIKQN